MSLFRSRPARFIPLFVCLAASALLPGTVASVRAAELRIALQDAESGAPLADAVVEVLLPAELQAAHTTTGEFSVDQIDKEFVANVTVVPRGTTVTLATNSLSIWSTLNSPVVVCAACSSAGNSTSTTASASGAPDSASCKAMRSSAARTDATVPGSRALAARQTNRGMNRAGRERNRLMRLNLALTALAVL